MASKPNIKLDKLKTAEATTKICDDFYVGTTKVLTKTYLPKWSGETDAGYKARLAQTAFANMFAPVVDGLAGMITRKPATITGYDNTDNIDLSYNSLSSFIKQSIKKSITNGIHFVGAETNTTENRAYLKGYEYKDLYSYIIENDVLQQIVFKEVVEVKDGEFGLKNQERYVVFKIGGGDVWYAQNDGGELTKDVSLTWSNSLKEIPVLSIVTGKVLSPFEVMPKLLDIANLNKVHLNLETNLANVLGVIGNPVPMFFGRTTEAQVTIGVKDALVFDDKQTQGASYLEPEAKGVSKIQEKIKATEEQIDKLTFSILLNTDSKTVVDAQENQSKNTSFLTDVANEVENKFTKLLQLMAELENKNVASDATFEMQKDFDATLVDMEIAFKALQAGNMSQATFYEIMKTGKLPKDFDVADEKEKIESD